MADPHDPRRQYSFEADPETGQAIMRKMALLDQVISHMVWHHEHELAAIVADSSDPEWAAAIVADALAQADEIRRRRAGG